MQWANSYPRQKFDSSIAKDGRAIEKNIILLPKFQADIGKTIWPPAAILESNTFHTRLDAVGQRVYPVKF